MIGGVEPAGHRHRVRSPSETRSLIQADPTTNVLAVDTARSWVSGISERETVHR